MDMLPRLGAKYNLEIVTISKPGEDYRTVEHLASGLPAAPAIILGDELLIQGCPINEEALESAIRRHLEILVTDGSPI
jgi:hypothetical protein